MRWQNRKKKLEKERKQDYFTIDIEGRKCGRRRSAPPFPFTLIVRLSVLLPGKKCGKNVFFLCRDFRKGTFSIKECRMQIVAEKENEIVRETAQLIDAFKAGQKESFDRLVTLYASKLYRTAYGLLNSKQDAEEVVQDAFMRAYRALDSFRGDSSFETWMQRIVINLARQQVPLEPAARRRIDNEHLGRGERKRRKQSDLSARRTDAAGYKTGKYRNGKTCHERPPGIARLTPGNHDSAACG